jgi:hypothetical protein
MMDGEAMAQTKRKRQTKHRGTAAGTVTARGRTGRKPTGEEVRKGDKRQVAQARREQRLATPPTWKGSLKRAAIITAVFVALMIALKAKPGAIISLLPITLGLYTVMSYYTDLFMHRRYVAKRAKGDT